MTKLYYILFCDLLCLSHGICWEIDPIQLPATKEFIRITEQWYIRHAIPNPFRYNIIVIGLSLKLTILQVEYLPKLVSFLCTNF